MRDYEVVYIFKSSLTTEEIEGRLESYHGKILGVEGSEITAVEHWGKRQLAYPIDRNDNGYYVVTQFTASPAVLPDFERVLKLDDDLLRHLVVLSEGELPVPVLDDRGDDRNEGGDEKRGRDESPEDGKDAGEDADAEEVELSDDVDEAADADDETDADGAADEEEGEASDEVGDEADENGDDEAASDDATADDDAEKGD